MTIIENPGCAWACVLAGLLAYGGWLGLKLAGKGPQGRLPALPRWLTALLLPGATALLMARGGYALLQFEETYAAFRWCYTTGLMGLALGTFLTARLNGARGSWLLDEGAAAACLCMAAARLSQRWLGETGVGPILDSGGLLTMINEWDEPLLATFLIETGICLLAAAATAVFHRRTPRAAGGTFCVMIHFLLDPQVLAEHFRSGEYMRFMMMRLEQALYGLAALGALIWLCEKARRAGRMSLPKAYAPALAYLAAAGAIVLAEFLLDGKILESCPPAVSWSLFAAAVAAMLLLAVFSARRLDRARDGKEQIG